MKAAAEYQVKDQPAGRASTPGQDATGISDCDGLLITTWARNWNN